MDKIIIDINALYSKYAGCFYPGFWKLLCSMPDNSQILGRNFAFVPVSDDSGGFILAFAVENEAGYVDTPVFFREMDRDKASGITTELNGDFGIENQYSIIMSSINKQKIEEALS